MKRIFDIAYVIFLLAVIGVAGLTWVASSNTALGQGLSLYSVQSGSMEPAIKTGSIVLVKSTGDYQIDDVITFRSQSETGEEVLTTHRIAKIEQNGSDGGTQFQTKGDANDSVDGNLVPLGNVVGEVVYTIPVLGKIVTFTRSLEGLVILVIIPATIIIYSELMNIKKEAARLIKERKKRKLTKLEEAEVAVGQEVEDVEEKIKKAVHAE